MSAPALHPRFESDLHSRYRELDLMEEEIKRRIANDQTSLAGVRELKRQISQQIFDSSAALTESPLQSNVSPTTSLNGTNTGIPRPI